ncbi:hypothetical protein JCM6882_005945 [Rhodosporidiobolus microsporus]
MHFTLPLVATLLAAASPAFSAPTGNVEERAVVGCKSTFQCRSAARPRNSDATCVQNVCSYQCYDGYTDYGSRCIKSSSSSLVWYAAPTTTTTTSAAAASPTVTLTPNAISAAGVTAFAGNNTNAIISWFHTNLSTDSTNGHSWCGFPYSDAVPGFAPSLKTMLANFNGSYEAAATAFCGLEATVIGKDGRNATLYIADAFDDTWVRTPASIDVVYDSFSSLFGTTTTNKNDVVVGGSWTLTGNRNERYKFKGLGATGL